MTAIVSSMINLASQIVFTLQGLLLDFKACTLTLKSQISVQKIGKKAKIQKEQWRAEILGETSFGKICNLFPTLFNRK